MRGFISIFEAVEDPRAGNARHDLLELLFIALAAVLCGAESCADMADFGAAKEEMLREVLRLEHGIPSHDTFSRVFRLLDPAGFEAAFTRFMAAFAKSNRLKGVVAIDGKAVKGAFAKGAKATPLHLVNVWAAEQGLALAQRLAPGTWPQRSCRRTCCRQAALAQGLHRHRRCLALQSRHGPGDP